MTKEDLLALLREHLDVQVKVEYRPFAAQDYRVEVVVRFDGVEVAKDHDTLPRPEGGWR